MSAPAGVVLLTQLARLVAALEAADGGAEERRAALRAAARSARGTGVMARLHPDGLHVDGARVAGDASVDAVAHLLAAHGLGRLVVRQHAPARELAQLAGVLARGGAGRDPAAELAALRLWHVQLDACPAASLGPVDLLPAPARAALAALAAATGPGAVAQAYDELATWIDATLPPPAADGAPGATAERDEAAARAGAVVTRALAHAVAHVLGRETRGDCGHLGGLTVLLVSSDLRPVVEAVADGTVPAGTQVLQCVAAAAVPLLIERLAAAATIAERQRCCDALTEIGGGVETLLQALGDARWYVVRNVALVCGELRLEPAVRALARCLAAGEPRVRDAAARALDQIDTTSSVLALRPALRDRAVEVRRIAARATARAARRHVAVAAATCIATLDAETDPEVIQELLAALGAVGSPDALRYLHGVVTGRTRREHEPEARAAALRALAGTRAAAGRAGARALLVDDDATVRQLAVRVLLGGGAGAPAAPPPPHRAPRAGRASR